MSRGGSQKSFARPQTQKKTPGNTGCLVSIERAAVLDPHVPRADALLGVGQGGAKKFRPPQTQNKTPGNTGCLVSIERSAVLDPHVPRADALLGVGQGQPVEHL